MSTPFKIYYFEDLSVGMRETLMKAVMDDDVIAFADLSGDRNPIHLSDHFASKTRFGERIVHGLYTASLISTVIGMYLPGPGAVYLSQTLNFRAPVKIGDVITVIVEMVELIEKGRRAELIANVSSTARSCSTARPSSWCRAASRRSAPQRQRQQR